tara:strand:+ start:111 stop:428 length:318 start_codon:yes stop_codon:yes gene_type:complete
MTSISAPTVKDQEFVSIGLVESASVNSIADFIPSKLNDSQVITENEQDDFKNTFICHLIFYAFFCVSLVLYVFIDLGLGSFIKNKFFQLMGDGKKAVFEKGPAFA